MTKTYTLFLFLILFVVASCGGGSGSGPQTSGERTMETKTCAVTFEPGDAPELVAQKAHKARVECQLTEEQVVALLVVI